MPFIPMTKVMGFLAYHCKTSNSYMYVANGQFVYEVEGMQGLWQKADLPELPKTPWKYKWSERFYWCNNPECKEYHKYWFQEWKVKNDEKQFGYKAKCNWCYKDLTLVEDDMSEFPNE